MIALILLIAALVCFVLAAFGVPMAKLNLLAAGLALYVGSLLVARVFT